VLGQVAQLFPRPRFGPAAAQTGRATASRVLIFPLFPLPGTELDEAEYAGGLLPRGPAGRPPPMGIRPACSPSSGAGNGRVFGVRPDYDRASCRVSHWASNRGRRWLKWTTASGSGSGMFTRSGPLGPPAPRPGWSVGHGGAGSWRRHRTAQRAGRSTFSLTRVAVDPGSPP